MKFGILKERKNPPDRRVVFSPNELARLKQLHPSITVKVESSDVRIFPEEYRFIFQRNSIKIFVLSF